MRAQGYAAFASDRPLAPFSFERREPTSNDVVLDILYCGVCHSDLHLVRNEWHNTSYPIVPGHEIVGRVTQVGGAVARFRPGDLVGVGCMIDSCLRCGSCRTGLEQYCESGYTATCGGPDGAGGITQGGYSTSIVVREEFVLRIPAGLDPAAAAPLLCAGITTWSPLRHWKVGPEHRVGIIGLGGLGHIAVRLARALGARVTVLTSHQGKTEDALRLGAEDVLPSTDAKALASAASRFDLLLHTVSVPTDLGTYMNLLRRDGAMVMLGAPAGQHTPPATYALEFARRSLAGSIVGGVAETQQLLDFCGRTGIGCDVERVAPSQVNEAFVRMERGEVKYRFVLDLALGLDGKKSS